MREKGEIKKYVEIYENMPISILAKNLNIDISELEQNIGTNPTLEDLIDIVQLSECIPICITNLSLLHLTIQSIMANDIFIPTVTIMGHINHGKSSLVERLINQNICQKEAGNITQNISLFNFHSNKGDFTLIDTPGHAALQNMRNIIIPLSEIIIIVIAANAGPQEETIQIIEKTNHKNRIVCINKIDAPNLINEDYIYHKSLQHGLVCDNDITPIVKISAKNNTNINELIDAIYTMINKQKYKTDISRPALGYIIDSFILTGKGKIIRILLKAGMCTIGDMFCLNGNIYTIGRMWVNDILCKKNEYIHAGQYIDIVCDAKCVMGDIFFVLNNKTLQNAVCQLQLQPNQLTHDGQELKFVIYISTIQQHNLLSSMLPANSIVKIHMNNTISKEDIIFAKENNLRMIIWYKIAPNIQELLDTYQVKYLASQHILIGDIETFLIEKKEEEKKDKITGIAQIKAIFYMKKDTILGNDVKSGEILLGNKCNIKRNDILIGTGTIRSLQHQRENIDKAKMGTECGLIIKDLTYTNEKFEYIVGDVIECLE